MNWRKRIWKRCGMILSSRPQMHPGENHPTSPRKRAAEYSPGRKPGVSVTKDQRSPGRGERGSNHRWLPNLVSCFLPLGQERSTKSHKIARTQLAPVRVISWIAFPGKAVFQKRTPLYPDLRYSVHSVALFEGSILFLSALTPGLRPGLYSAAIFDGSLGDSSHECDLVAN
jgi:hypothetical protein